MSCQPWVNLTSTPLPQIISVSSAIVSDDGYIYVMGG